MVPQLLAVLFCIGDVSLPYKERDLKGVILAAGKGSRLYPVTHHIPKPLLPLANRPTLEYAFDRLKEMEVTDICIVVGEMEEQMKRELGDGSQFGIRLSYVRQTQPQGLAHAVGFAKDFVSGDDFVLYLGDAMYSDGSSRQCRTPPALEWRTSRVSAS
jgi:glucose-1-phosphate thymidylyltransferase